MKNYMLFMILLFANSIYAVSQDSMRLKKMTLRAKIALVNGKTENGYLQQVDESQLVISTVSLHYGTPIPNDAVRQQFHYYDINSLVLRKPNAGGTTTAIGAISGLVIGALIGFTHEQNSSGKMHIQGASAATYGLVGCLIGAGIGVSLTPLVKRKYKIGGRSNDYESMRVDVLNWTYH